jgi:hypothetical protein
MLYISSFNPSERVGASSALKAPLITHANTTPLPADTNGCFPCKQKEKQKIVSHTNTISIDNIREKKKREPPLAI